MYHHLQQRHKVEYEECIKLRDASQKVTSDQSSNPKAKQVTLENTLARTAPFDKTSKRWRDITNAIAYHIAKDLAPIATVEQTGFIQMFKIVEPRYQLPSRRHIANEVLPKMYKEIRAGMDARFAKVPHFALTSDMWSSRTCEPYMCVTIHFMEEWAIKSACLQTSYFPQDNTGEHIAEALKDVLSSWKLDPEKLVAVTTDNGTNVVKALQLNKWLRMQCFGHRLHLAIGKFSTEIIFQNNNVCSQ